MSADTIVTVLSALAGLVGTAIAVMQYFSRRDKQTAARLAFRNVVDSLSSTSEVQRLGGAILLRRFLDPTTELGQGRTPYARETIDVMAAILREVKSGNFQKLLADGLRYAPALEGTDLQRTNLQKAYLGRKGDETPNLIGADFYRADLSGTSLKGANATGAVFYQARLHNAILKDVRLVNANFFEADLLGVNLTGAFLFGASFLGARNVPPGLAEHIGPDGHYVGPERFPPPKSATSPGATRVFISKPGALTGHQGEVVGVLTSLLADEAIDVATVERDEYANAGAVAEVRRVMSGCAGVIVLAFRQVDIRDGTWRAGTAEAEDLRDVALPTAWNHVEGGMAAMVGLPTLCIVERGMIGGLFDFEDVNHVVINLDVQKPDYPELREVFGTWCSSVREARR